LLHCFKTSQLSINNSLRYKPELPTLKALPIHYKASRCSTNFCPPNLRHVNGPKPFQINVNLKRMSEENPHHVNVIDNNKWRTWSSDVVQHTHTAADNLQDKSSGSGSQTVNLLTI
jgi:hypothetical protein